MSNNQSRKIRIISKTRFSIFLTILIILITLSLSLVLPIVSKSLAKEYDLYIKVCVEKGDTLWRIAKRTLPEGTDIRDYIKDIRNVNKLDSANIKAGQILIVPVKSSEGHST